MFSSGLLGGGTASYETVNREHGEAKETNLVSANSPLSQHPSKLEAKDGSEHVQQKTRPRMSQERRNTKGIFLPRSEDCANVLFATKDKHFTESTDHLIGTNNIKPKKFRLSSENSTKKLPQSVDMDTNCTSGPHLVIPKYIALKASLTTTQLKLFKDSEVHMEGNDETAMPTVGIKKSESCENTQNLSRNKKGRFVSKPKFVDERQHSVTKRFCANVEKRSLASRQHSVFSEQGLVISNE